MIGFVIELCVYVVIVLIEDRFEGFVVFKECCKFVFKGR